MPATPDPVVDPRYGPHNTAIIQAIQQLQQQMQQLTAGQTQGNLVDSAGNTVEVAGTNLNQTVTIGATFASGGTPAMAGVMVGTGLTGAGRAFQQGLATGTITLTAGSKAATLTNASTFGIGMVVGAADVSDPTSGTATPAIVPGTTITAISGSSVTLSLNAAETGSGLYCCGAYFRLLADLVYP